MPRLVVALVASTSLLAQMPQIGNTKDQVVALLGAPETITHETCGGEHPACPRGTDEEVMHYSWSMVLRPETVHFIDGKVYSVQMPSAPAASPVLDRQRRGAVQQEGCGLRFGKPQTTERSKCMGTNPSSGGTMETIMRYPTGTVHLANGYAYLVEGRYRGSPFRITTKGIASCSE